MLRRTCLLAVVFLAACAGPVLPLPPAATPTPAGITPITFPRLAASGLLRDASGATVTISGLAWADHQWGDLVVSGTGGWDWFNIQLDNNTELLLARTQPCALVTSQRPIRVYVLRDRAGAPSAVFGSLIMPDSTVEDIGPGSVRVGATGQWLSPHTGATYPSGWLVELPEQQLVLTVMPELQDQELYFPGAVFAGPTYWEGTVDVHGSGAGSPTGVGYAELTGCAQPGPSSQ